MKSKKLYWRINNEIRSPELRVVGSDGKQVGVMKREEALRLSEKGGLDLVEIAPRAVPPVAKVVDFGKFRYQEEKKLRAQIKKTKTQELKEIRFSPFIAEGDYNTRFRRVEEFLNNGHKVRLVIVFKGRQLDSKKFGYELLDRMVKSLGERIVVDMKPKFLGRHLAMVISPLKNPAKLAVARDGVSKEKGEQGNENKAEN